MSVGKYSPCCPHARENDYSSFVYNCFGKIPELWSKEISDSGVEYDEKSMFDNYDSEGFDSYGYSAFDEYSNYVGSQNGVDRHGHTEHDYLMDSIDGGDLYETP